MQGRQEDACTVPGVLWGWLSSGSGSPRAGWVPARAPVVRGRGDQLGPRGRWQRVRGVMLTGPPGASSAGRATVARGASLGARGRADPADPKLRFPLRPVGLAQHGDCPLPPCHYQPQALN